VILLETNLSGATNVTFNGQRSNVADVVTMSTLIAPDPSNHTFRLTSAKWLC